MLPPDPMWQAGESTSSAVQCLPQPGKVSGMDDGEMLDSESRDLSILTVLVLLILCVL